MLLESIKPLQYFVPHFLCYIYFINVNCFLLEKCTDDVILLSISHLVYVGFVSLGSVKGVLSQKLSDSFNQRTDMELIYYVS